MPRTQDSPPHPLTRPASGPRRLLALLAALLLLATACTSEDSGDQTSGGLPASGDQQVLEFDDPTDDGRDEERDEEAAESTDDGAGDDLALDDEAMDEEESDATADLDSTQPPAPSVPDAATPQNPESTGASPLDAYLPPPTAEPLPVPTQPVSTVNPFVETSRDDRSTFGLDVDTGSFSYAQAQINRGQEPEQDLVRVEEFVNAVDYGYTADPAEVFTVHADLAPWPHGTDRDNVLLRVGLATPEATEDRPASLVFVVDTSGSMQELLPLVQDSLRILTRTLEPGDEVAIVTYSDSAEPVLRATDASQQDVILDGIDRLEIGGSTNLEAGLDVGYSIARELSGTDRTTRVILASDGIANVGSTSADPILETVRQGVSDGVELVTVGFGLGGFNDPLMEQLADRGDGFYTYVDTLGQAEALFSDDLIATRPAVAREARAQVVFDPAQIAAYRLIGYENRDIADDDFRDDEIDAGELLAGHQVTALYELQLTGTSTGDALATVQLRWLDPDDGTARERAFGVSAADISRTWDDAPADFRMAGTVAAWAEWLRGSPYATPVPGDLRRDASDLIGVVDGAADMTDLIRRSV